MTLKIVKYKLDVNVFASSFCAKNFSVLQFAFKEYFQYRQFVKHFHYIFGKCKQRRKNSDCI